MTFIVVLGHRGRQWRGSRQQCRASAETLKCPRRDALTLRAGNQLLALLRMRETEQEKRKSKKGKKREREPRQGELRMFLISCLVKPGEPFLLPLSNCFKVYLVPEN